MSPRVARRAIRPGVVNLRQSLPHRDHSSGAQPRVADGAQTGGTVDPIGRAMPGQRHAGDVLDDGDASPEVGGDGPGRQSQLEAVAISVQCHRMAFGDDPRRELRPALHLLANQEEGGAASAAARTSSTAGVPSGWGPSSKVRATPRVPGSVRGRDRPCAASLITGAST